MGVAVATGAILLGGLLFGGDLVSYVRTGVSSVRQEVRSAIPIEVELERAREMIREITPELQSNIQLIVGEEMAVTGLKKEIELAQSNLLGQRQQVVALKSQLDGTQNVSLVVGQRQLPRNKVVEKLASRVGRFKQAQAQLDSKLKMLEIRERSLSAAQDMFEKTKTRKAELEQKVESLVAKHRLVKAQAVATSIHIDNSQLARADRLMKDIEKRLETASRIISYEADLENPQFDDVLVEEDVIEEANSCLGNCDEAETDVDFDLLMTQIDSDNVKVVRVTH
jgi:DNA repair exonuclease SbcCD ATPase subunit